jgi:uncharacterized protein YlzI (FlbEa/FlbD family)
MVDLTLNRKTKIERIRRKGLTMVDLTLNRKTKIERIRRKGLTSSLLVTGGSSVVKTSSDQVC